MRSFIICVPNQRFIVTEKNRLLVFERRVLRQIYGPTQDNDGAWRIKTNEELDNLIKKKQYCKI